MTERLVIPEFKGDDYYLSNFHPSIINIEPVDQENSFTFYTGEHMFQALKWKSMLGADKGAHVAYVRKILENPNPGHAKREGQKVKIDVAHWESIRIDMMRETVWEKFKQNSELRERLLSTGSAMLVEGNDWGDKFWGRVDGKGYNLLGSILMEVRGGFRFHDRSKNRWAH